jgi:hypothetical protein
MYRCFVPTIAAQPHPAKPFNVNTLTFAQLGPPYGLAVQSALFHSRAAVSIPIKVPGNLSGCYSRMHLKCVLPAFPRRALLATFSKAIFFL